VKPKDLTLAAPVIASQHVPRICASDRAAFVLRASNIFTSAMRLAACVCFLGVLGVVVAERSALRGFRALQNATDTGFGNTVQPPPAAATPATPAVAIAGLTPVEQEFVNECGQQIRGCGAAPDCKACVTNSVQVSALCFACLYNLFTSSGTIYSRMCCAVRRASDCTHLTQLRTDQNAAASVALHTNRQRCPLPSTAPTLRPTWMRRFLHAVLQHQLTHHSSSALSASLAAW
jgi:hypothetical protein